MEKKMENEMETGIIGFSVGSFRIWGLRFKVNCLGLRVKGL